MVIFLYFKALILCITVTYICNVFITVIFIEGIYTNVRFA